MFVAMPGRSGERRLDANGQAVRQEGPDFLEPLLEAAEDAREVPRPEGLFVRLWERLLCHAQSFHSKVLQRSGILWMCFGRLGI